jgi:hypothetical protein
VATKPDRSSAGQLVDFVDEAVAWSETIGLRFLERDEREQLRRAAIELRHVQLPRLEEELAHTPHEDLEAAGFSPAQTEFKTAVARRTMRAAEEAIRPSPTRTSRRPSLELVGTAIEGIKEILGSIKGLSKWIEAFSEFVGLVGAGVKRAGAVGGFADRMRRRFLGR